jgi:cytochrome P450
LPTPVAPALDTDGYLNEGVDMATAEESCEALAEYNPFIPPVRDDPYPAWARLRRQHPVFYSAALDAWVVTRHADICAILRDPVRFSNAGATRPLAPPPPEVAAVLAEGFAFEAMPPLLATDPPLHTRLRKFANAAFTNQRIAGLEPRIRVVASGLLDQMVLSGPGRAEFVSRFAFPLPLIIVGDLIGVPHEDHDRLHRWSEDKFAVQWGNLPLDEYKVAARGFVDFQRYCAALIDARRQESRDDLVSAMVAIRIEGEQPLSTGELVGHLMGLVAAGHETTMNLLAHAVFHLLMQREQWDALVADPPGLAAGAVEETLRYDSSVSGMWRTTTEDVWVGGVPIPKGARVQVLYGSANRDEAAFPDRPDVFDIARSPSATGPQHLAFGRGVHLRAEWRWSFSRRICQPFAWTRTPEPSPGARTRPSVVLSRFLSPGDASSRSAPMRPSSPTATAAWASSTGARASLS